MNYFEFKKLLDETGETPCMSAPSFYFSEDTVKPGNGGDEAYKTRLAKKLCQGCPLVLECLEYAIDNEESFGIWGGLTPRERRGLRHGRAA